MSHRAVREAGTSLRYIQRFREALELQHTDIAMSVAQKFGAWCGKKVPRLKYYTMENIRQRSERCKEGCRTFALQREGKVVTPTSSMVVARNGWHFLPSVNTEGTAL